MKKLMMFAATMTIVGGAFAQGGCTDPEPIEKPVVYRVTMNLRTVMGKGRTTTVSSACQDDAVTASCIRFPLYPYPVHGYIVNCEWACDAITSEEVYLWNPKLRSTLLEPTFAWTFLHVLGRQGGANAEALWDFTGVDSVIDDGAGDNGVVALRGAGFGVYNYNLGLYTSFRGMAVGTLSFPKCLSTGENCTVASYWLCTDLTQDDEDPSVMFGTWAMRLDVAASKAVWANRTAALSKMLPKYFVFEAEDR